MSQVSRSMPTGAGIRLLVTRARSTGQVDLVLGTVFILSAGFYWWTAGTAMPLSLHGGPGDRYNLLATALLHFHLSIGPAPSRFLHLANPYNSNVNGALLPGISDATTINDDVLYNGQLYFIWGPVPALVLLVPLHLLGFEPSRSVTVAFYAIAGLGFALAILRVLIRQIGDLPMWMCTLAGLAVSLSSAVPFILRPGSASEDTIAGGFCFTMAGIWLATSALVSKNASRGRLILMSLCFGFAAGSRPTLALTALVLIPVYLALRPGRSRRELLMSLAVPVGVCFVLLLAYNQARFHNPFEVGSRYQLSGYESRTAPFGHLSYVLPGLGFYAVTPPRFTILFPFILLSSPQTPSPVGLAGSAPTGGLLPMAPIVIFIAALPWIWRRRPAPLGALAAPLLILAGAGIAMAMWVSYQLFASTERYEVDFATLLVLGGLASWLSLSVGTPGHRRRIVRLGGGLLVAWGCATGLAISLIGYADSFPSRHPATWKTLEDIGSPVSTALAIAVGHPVLAAVSAHNTTEASSDYGSLGTWVTEFSLSPTEQAGITVVSPDARRSALVANVALLPGTQYGVRIGGPASASHSDSVPAGGGPIDIPILLNRGLNRFTLSLIATSVDHAGAGTQVMLVRGLSVAGGQ